jgi:hypothetical protein
MLKTLLAVSSSCGSYSIFAQNMYGSSRSHVLFIHIDRANYWVILSEVITHYKMRWNATFHNHLQAKYSTPFPFLHCGKLALFCNLNFTEVKADINFEKHVIHYLNFVLNLLIWIYSCGGECKFHETLKGRKLQMSGNLSIHSLFH